MGLGEGRLLRAHGHLGYGMSSVADSPPQPRTHMEGEGKGDVGVEFLSVRVAQKDGADR